VNFRLNWGRQTGCKDTRRQVRGGWTGNGKMEVLVKCTHLEKLSIGVLNIQSCYVKIAQEKAGLDLNNRGRVQEQTPNGKSRMSERSTGVPVS